MRGATKWILMLVVTASLMVQFGCQRDGAAPGGGAGGASGGDGKPLADPGAVAQKSGQDPRHPVIEIDTDLGKFAVQLDQEKAPLTTENFLEYVASHFYDGTTFHQILNSPAKIVLGGSYGSDGVEKKARTAIRNEADNGLKNKRGTIAMARTDAVDSARSMFFINVADNAMLDYQDRAPDKYGYCVFGQVVQGMETVDRIAQAQVADKGGLKNAPVETIHIKSVRRVK